MFEYKKCEYCYIKLVPIKSNKNNNTEQIASLINKMFKQSSKYIRQEGKGVPNKRLQRGRKPHLKKIF